MDTVERAAALRQYAEETSTCTRCALAKGRTQVVFGSGSPDADLMFVGEAPGFHEDQQGVPFVGQAGKLLDKLLGGHRAHARGRLRRERAQVPASGQPRSAARGDRLLRAAPLPPDRADPAEARRDARELRDQAPLGQAGGHHEGARVRAGGHARRADGAPVSALPPGGRALHAVDAEGARGGLRAHPGAPRAHGRRARRRRDEIRGRRAPSRSPSRYSSASSDVRVELASASASETERIAAALAGRLVVRRRRRPSRASSARARRRSSAAPAARSA